MTRTERTKRIHVARGAARNLHRLQAIGHYGAGRVSDPVGCAMPHLDGLPIVLTEIMFIAEQVHGPTDLGALYAKADSADVRLARLYLRSLRRDGFRSPVYC